MSKVEREFEEGGFYNIVYSVTKHCSGNADTIYRCPSCGCSIWKTSYRAGAKNQLGKLDIKLKCKECGLWFITKEELLEKCLGVVK
jgi:hypothetical protein